MGSAFSAFESFASSLKSSKFVTLYKPIWDYIGKTGQNIVIAIATTVVSFIFRIVAQILNFIFSLPVLSHILAYFTGLVQRLLANWDILLAVIFGILLLLKL